MVWRLRVGGLAERAGLRSVHSHRIAASKAPERMLWMPWMVLLAIGLHTCGQQPDSLQSWPGRRRAGWRRVLGPSAVSSPAIVVVRPWRMWISPSSASARNACRTVPGFSPCSSCSSGTDGRASPGARSVDRIAARSLSAACCHPGTPAGGLRQTRRPQPPGTSRHPHATQQLNTRPPPTHKYPPFGMPARRLPSSGVATDRYGCELVVNTS
jgi:hypothetical protein